MNKCKFCTYRFSWDCEDKIPYYKERCNDFELDENTLTEEEKRRFVLEDIIKDRSKND